MVTTPRLLGFIAVRVPLLAKPSCLPSSALKLVRSPTTKGMDLGGSEGYLSQKYPLGIQQDFPPSHSQSPPELC